MAKKLEIFLPNSCFYPSETRHFKEILPITVSAEMSPAMEMRTFRTGGAKMRAVTGAPTAP